GCSSTTPLGQPIRVASAYMILSGGQRTVDGYLVIQNIGPADQLVSVSSSKGGTVTFVRSGAVGPADGMPAPSGRGLLIPGHSTIRLDPAGTHLVISNSSRLKDGTYITLTLDFAHAGRINVNAQVTNPQNGNYTYFGP
ncbi:MAG: copper chaperone PCu(A)C, partial [Streptosporangiaceae bacterium]